MRVGDLPVLHNLKKRQKPNKRLTTTTKAKYNENRQQQLSDGEICGEDARAVTGGASSYSGNVWAAKVLNELYQIVFVCCCSFFVLSSYFLIVHLHMFAAFVLLFRSCSHRAYEETSSLTNIYLLLLLFCFILDLLFLLLPALIFFLLILFLQLLQELRCLFWFALFDSSPFFEH